MSICGHAWNFNLHSSQKPLSFTHHTFTDLLSTPPIYWSPTSNFKGLAFVAEFHSNSHGVRLYYIRQTLLSSWEEGLGTRLVLVMPEFWWDNCHISQSDCAAEIPGRYKNVVLYSPDPPFLLEGWRSGFETTLIHALHKDAPHPHVQYA